MLALIRLFRHHPLTGFLGWKAFYNFIGWQLRVLVKPKRHIHKWIQNSRFYVARNETGLTGNIYVGLHEFSDMGFLLHFLNRNDLFIDAGANSGSYTILASAVVGAKTVAFEPVPATFKRLESNIELNEIEKLVRAKCVGLSSSSGTMYMTVDSDTTNRLVSGDDCFNAVQVPVSKLDDFDFGESPVLLKIDVEGWEYEVLNGAKQLLANRSLLAVILEINDNAAKIGIKESEILNFLSSFGFRAYLYEPLTRELFLLEGKNIMGGNTLFLRELGIVKQRLKVSPEYRILGKVF